MKRRGKKVLLVCVGTVLGLVLAALAFVFSVVKEEAPYEFMRGAKQDGFWAPILSGWPEVNRFYVIERPTDQVVRDALKELTRERGWKSQREKGVDGAWSFEFGDRKAFHVPAEASVWIEPIAGSKGNTSVVVMRDSTKVEEIIGTTYEWFPERYADWR
jgi:hypothetical protein